VTVSVQESSGPLLVVLVVLLIVALAAAVLAWRRAAALGRRLDILTRGNDGDSLEDVLGASIGQVVQLSSEVAELAVRTGALEKRGRKALQRIGLVRYNPFEDTGGNQSFALALLDADDDGIVISSLHARGGTRIYAKAIAAGRPEAALSEEETQALTLARGATAGRVALQERVATGVGGR
jgi:hypothetical protein